jgi:hypothetical protein
MGAQLDPDSSTAKTALLLLAACELGQGVHKLALLTGFPPEFVARCARRLVDNGVWQDGATVSPWVTSLGDLDAFWADVAVAEGKLYRRVNADGQLEWGRPGEWWKELQDVAVAAGYSASTRYCSRALPVATDDSPYEFLRPSEEPETVPAEPAPRVAAESPRLQRRPELALPAPGNVVLLGSAGLASDVVWLV